MIHKAIKLDEIIQGTSVEREEKWSEDSAPEYININTLGRRGGTSNGDGKKMAREIRGKAVKCGLPDIKWMKC